MISRDDADEIAEYWVVTSGPSRTRLTPRIEEFDLGYVIWGQPPHGVAPELTANRAVLDRETGELSIWPSMPVEMVIDEFRAQRAEYPPAPKTWDAGDELWRQVRRVVTPTNLTYLTLDSGIVVAHGVKSDLEPNHHPLVRQYYAEEMPREYRERGYDRCSEAAAFSDALHVEDTRRAQANRPPITLAEARTELFGGGAMATYRSREPGDPVGGANTPPCISCAFLARHFGFEIRPPWQDPDDANNTEPAFSASNTMSEAEDG